MNSRSLQAHLALVTITMIWGASFPVNKAALGFASPLSFNAVRMLLAVAILALIYRKRLAEISRPAFKAGATVGVFLFMGYALQTPGLKFTTPTKSAFLTGISALLVPVLVVTIWKGRIHLWRGIGVAAATIGLFLMTVPAGKQGIADFANVNRGDLLTLACAFAFAFHIILLGRATVRFPFQQIAVLQLGVAAALMTLAAPLLERPWIQPSPVLVGAMLFTGIFSTGLGFTVQCWAQQFTPPTHAALIFTMEPVFAWFISYLLTGERLSGRAMVGAFLILAGVLISETLGNLSDRDLSVKTVQPGGAG